MAAGQVANLESGDALYIPGMWRHSTQRVLAPIDDIQARQLRAWLINRLNR